MSTLFSRGLKSLCKNEIKVLVVIRLPFRVVECLPQSAYVLPRDGVRVLDGLASRRTDSACVSSEFTGAIS